MIAHVTQLYPQPGGVVPLPGLYLAQRLHELGTPKRPFIYANFVASLDGRIALQESDGNESYVPKSLTTRHDWLLFQELQAQADCFVVHGGYLRALAAGRLGNVLQVGLRPESRYLLDWRGQNDLPDQPGIVIVSASLNFNLPESLRGHGHGYGQRVHIVTGTQADPHKVRAWRAFGIDVQTVGSGQQVASAALASVLRELGYRSIYLQAGPQLLESALRDNVLGRFYLTISHQILGGEGFHTLIAGRELDGAGRLKLRSLYFDAPTTDYSGQFFACFEPF